MKKILLAFVLIFVPIHLGYTKDEICDSEITTSRKDFTNLDDQKNETKGTVGIASFYHDKFHGRRTANQEIFDQSKFTAAHKTLPFGTKLLVKNLSNDKEVIVVINDRGPFIKNRVLDLSRAAAEELDFIKKGLQKVEYTIIE